MHLAQSATKSSVSPSAWPSWNGTWPHASDPPGPDRALLAGIAAYRRHPYVRTLIDPPAIWAEGDARLLDYGAPDAPPLLFVPSLVNRAHVLDLMEGRSMLRFLAAHGVRPLLLDWGYPDQSERAFTLTDLVAGRLERALAAAVRSARQPVTLAGYCMGGLLAVAAAGRRPDLVSRLVLLATPWDFSAPDRQAATRLAGILPWLEPALSFGGAMPVDALQMLFSLADPGSVGDKYRDFASQDQASPRAQLFVALEDWLNDGVPLAAPVAREVLGGWYGRNTPATDSWRIAGEVVRPKALAVESFVAIPARDRIVPAESALALAARLSSAVVHRPSAGHVGMVAGSRAEVELWAPLLAWLQQSAPSRTSQHCSSPGPKRALGPPHTTEGSMADIGSLAREHGISEEAARVLAEAVRRGGGRMAQFSHTELGGMGQWSAGGMTQIGAMGDSGLRDRVAALCAALADAPPPATAPTPEEGDWWPAGLGRPSATGAQNGVRYACFPDARRVAIEQGGHVTVYDSGEHRISGVSQSQGAGRDLVFSSQSGSVRAQDLAVV